MEKFSLPYVVIFIPCYNEEEVLPKTVNNILSKISGENQCDFVADIIVIDDGSKDKTREVASSLPVKRVISHPRNMGLGAGTRTGMLAALEMGADIAVKIDGDFQFDGADIEKIIAPILEDRADVVFGSRFLSGKEYYGKELYKKIGNIFFSQLTSKIVGMKITDAQTGFIAFHKRYLKKFNIIGNYNETQQLIIDSWGKHMRIMEISVFIRQRVTGKSFINFFSWKYLFYVLPNMIRAFIHFKPLRFFFFSGLTLLVTAVVLALMVLISPTIGIAQIDMTIVILVIVGFQIIFFGLLADQNSYHVSEK
ncbi:glycosyltransferase family 2 protein [Patescibacteria group bacterium]|nr:glycosyltransferase family 2 protein [Patescibacteria group bacterium]